jgi:hypothetical protein
MEKRKLIVELKDLTEKESETNIEQKTKQPTSQVKEVKRYSGEKNKRVSEKQTESQTGPRHPLGKNKDANSNLPQI